MHESSYSKMKDFAERYLDPSKPLDIVDLGSMDIYGCYRSIFDRPAWTYRGMDVEEGKNVDIILKNPYVWDELPDNSVDLFVSGQALEHMEYFWLVFDQIHRKLKPEGLACVIAPSRGPEHRYPVDCYRFFPDAYRAMARWSGLELLEVSTDSDSPCCADSSNLWGDTLGVFRKPRSPLRPACAFARQSDNGRNV